MHNQIEILDQKTKNYWKRLSTHFLNSYKKCLNCLPIKNLLFISAGNKMILKIRDFFTNKFAVDSLRYLC